MTQYPNFAYDYQLTIDRLLERTLRWAPDQKIVYRDLVEYTYADLGRRVRKLASMLSSLGVRRGDAVAFMDWDSHRYLEAYFAVPMMGAVLHTVNVRLSPEQILYTINHAEDRVLVVHRDFLPLIDKIRMKLETVKRIVIVSDGHQPEVAPWAAGDHEELLGTASDAFDFPALDERTIATTFYTTGTTGNPKGVFFTHRQIVLQAMMGMGTFGGFTDPISFRSGDVYMPITPMFHVHAWGVPYMATMLGVKQVYPGRYEPEMLLKLLVKHRVTFSHCVPTILQMILSSPAAADVDLSRWKVVIGGSALPRGLAEAAIRRKVNVVAGYGLSETCPDLSVALLKPEMQDWPEERRTDYVVKAGFPFPFVDLRIVDPGSGAELPPGKKNVGEIVVRAPWLTPGYVKLTEKSQELWRDGWLHTGDLGFRDAEGYVNITDRLKDVIKTGGEWVSSLDLESLISQFEPVAEVAVIGVPDEKWGERPSAIVIERKGCEGRVTSASIANFLQKFVDAGHIEKWAIPDQVTIVESLPKTSVGKIDKKKLRGDASA